MCSLNNVYRPYLGDATDTGRLISEEMEKGWQKNPLINIKLISEDDNASLPIHPANAFLYIQLPFA